MNRKRIAVLVVCLLVLLGCGILPSPDEEIKQLPVVVETVSVATPSAEMVVPDVPVVPNVPNVPDAAPTEDIYLCEFNNKHPHQLLIEKFDHTYSGMTGMGVKMMALLVPDMTSTPSPSKMFISCVSADVLDILANGGYEKASLISVLVADMEGCGERFVIDANPTELKLFFKDCVAATYEFPELSLDIRPVPQWGTGELES